MRLHPAWYLNIGLALLLQALLLWRAARCGLWSHFPFFYLYLIYTAFRAVIVSFPLPLSQLTYSKLFWWSYLLAAMLRFGIAGEIHRSIFPRTSPLRMRAGIAVLFALLTVALIFHIQGAGPGHRYLDALRKIAFSVAAWIGVVLGMAQYYQVRLGRNVWGIAVGLLTFTGSELVYLAARDLVPRLATTWSYIHPIAFVLTLVIWTGTLWSYNPNPSIPKTDEISKHVLVAWQDRWAEVPNILRRVVKP